MGGVAVAEMDDMLAGVLTDLSMTATLDSSLSVGAEVLEEMARDFTPDAAWHVTLDENGKLLWSGESGGEPVQFSKDPGTSWWTRFVWGVMRVFPLENEL